MNFINDDALVLSSMGMSVVDPATFIRYEVVPVSVRATRAADFPRSARIPYRYHMRVLRSSPEGTLLSVFSPLNREWPALVSRVATLIRDLRRGTTTSPTTVASGSSTPTSTSSSAAVAADGTVIAVAPTTTTTSASTTTTSADVLADIDFGDEEEAMGGSRMTVSGSTAGLSGEGIMDRPWFWPVVIAGGIGAVVYLRRK